MLNVQVTAYVQQTIPHRGSNHITEMAEPKVVKFYTQVGNINSSKRIKYHPQKGAWLWSRDCFKMLPFVVMQCAARIRPRKPSYLLRYSEILVENRRSEPTPLLFSATVGDDLN